MKDIQIYNFTILAFDIIGLIIIYFRYIKNG
jgi:hypothetical protein